jgi:SAM-dependent methyltransferase
MSSQMKSFWDKRADEDAFFFVDNRMRYGSPNLERFWADGERDLDQLLGVLGASIDAGDEVLEIGCGVGRLTRVLAARASCVRALDVSERMLERARELNLSLTNVRWSLGDGSSLGGVDTGSVDVCVSHVVFQHIPDAEITLQYIREMGRVLRPGGWAAFQISNDPGVHDSVPTLGRLRQRVLAVLRRAPRGQNDRNWRGSMVEISDLRETVADGSMRIDRLVGEGTQFCCVLLVRNDD